MDNKDMAIQQFWSWFSTNQAAYLQLNDVSAKEKDRLLNNLLTELHRFSAHLYFQIGNDLSDDAELIISAEGNKEYFDSVYELVDAAPALENWKIIALKPAKGARFSIAHGGLVIEAGECWFMPMENEKHPTMLGVRVFIPGFISEQKKEYLFAVRQMLDTVLGEKSGALDIQHVDAALLPENPVAEGFIKLAELPDYIQWRKAKLN